MLGRVGEHCKPSMVQMRLALFVKSAWQASPCCKQCIAAGPPAAPGLPPPLPGAPPAGQLAVGGALSGAAPLAAAPAPANPAEPSPYVQVEGMVSAQVLADDEEYKDVSSFSWQKH